jgi:FkbM family methyltransferase
MLMDLKKLVKKYNLNITGVIHIGAHHGTELEVYEQLGIKNLVFFEPLKSNFEILRKKVGLKGDCYNFALGNDNKQVEMYVEVANSSQSCSILKPKFHLIQYPHIQFPTKEIVEMRRLDDVLGMFGFCNMINIDVQGYELEVFKGAINKLKQIDYIMTEINRVELYENCVEENELDEFLGNQGFKRVETDWAGQTWGDALYVKSKI